MDIKRTISITDARKDIFNIAEDVQKPGTYYTLTEKGRPKIVLMSAEEFESWRETLEIQKIFPDLEKRLKEADEVVRDGSYKDWTSLESILDREGLVVKEKKEDYEVRSKNRKTGEKES
ncbi:MAG: type II toxin-antitoxin system Phd/YefM family antitoxin [Candidatus Paceibacterota bacterium]